LKNRVPGFKTEKDKKDERDIKGINSKTLNPEP
jgi:hypothetical protein